METAVGHWLAALDAGALLDPDQYIHALSLALVCGDQKAVHRLAALGRDKYTHPAVEMSEVAYSLAGLLGELAGPKPGSKRAAAVEKAAAARAGTTPNIQDLAVPVALAVVAQDSAALQSASAAHLAGYSKIFKKSALRQRADSFLDCWSLGFLRIAVGKKMTLPGNNVYWGEALLTA